MSKLGEVASGLLRLESALPVSQHFSEAKQDKVKLPTYLFQMCVTDVIAILLDDVYLKRQPTLLSKLSDISTHALPRSLTRGLTNIPFLISW